MILVVSSVLLLLITILLFVYIFLINRQLREISRELLLTRNESYNRQLTVSLINRNLTRLAVEINRNLDYQKQLKLKSEQAELELKQSVSDIAHDLRTPLTVIKGNLQMLDQSGFVSESGWKHLKICREKTDVLRTMVDDFFELSVLESDQTVAQRQAVNMTSILTRFIVDQEAVIREHDLTPDIAIPERDVIVSADEQMLNRMLGNLLNNVIKYAKGSFRLSMEVQEMGTQAVCRILFANEVDSDCGIDVGHLFDRAYRGNQARQGSGAGLGLYIVKLLAKKQGAEVMAVQEGNELQLLMCFPMEQHQTTM